MDKLIEAVLSPYVLIYLLIVIGISTLHAYGLCHKHRRIKTQRHNAGLPDNILIDPTENLKQHRHESLSQALLLLMTIIVVPFFLVYATRCFNFTPTTTEKGGIALTFLVLLFWIFINGTDVSKAFLGGLAFKTLAAFKTPFQIGDRVTLKGISGRVTGLDIFYVTLQTLNDDQISIPTNTLWQEVLCSANAGERSSLCVMNFYLAPFVTHKQRQLTEDALWDAIQSSTYYDPAHSMQIYLSQRESAIELTAKAYVALTYNEPLFVSDVTRAFLLFAEENTIPLASKAWKVNVEDH